jgi:hypothetical protein
VKRVAIAVLIQRRGSSILQSNGDGESEPNATLKRKNKIARAEL